jgi:hypothetical protein
MPSRIVNVQSGTQVRLQILGSPPVGGIDLLVAEADCSTAVTASLVRVRARTAAINGSTAVSCSLVRTRARSATANGSTTVAASLVRIRGEIGVVDGSTVVTATVVRTRARSATATGATAVTCTITTAGVKLFTATISGRTTVTASLPSTEITPQMGGFVFQKKPPRKTTTARRLRPGHATVTVTAFAPRLTITETPGAPIIRTRPLAPMPTLIFQAAAASSATLGELPRSKRDLIDKVVIYDTV